MTAQGAASNVSGPSWRRYRLISESTTDVTCEISADGTIRWISPSVENLLSWQPETLVGKQLEDIVHSQDRPRLAALIAACLTSSVEHERIPLMVADSTGGFHEVTASGQSTHDSGQTVPSVVLTLADTHDRDAALRALATLSQANRVMVRATDEASLLDSMCATLVETGRYAMAWYGRAVDDAAKSVAIVARAGDNLGYLDEITVSWGDNEHGQGPTGRCLRNGTTEVQNSFAPDPYYEPWAKAADRRGFRCSISLPVMVDGVLDGALMAYAHESGAFDSLAVELFESLAADLGYGISRLRDIGELQFTNQREIEQRERVESIYNSVIDPLILMTGVRDANGQLVDLRYTEANTAALVYNQLTREQMIGTNLLDLFPGQLENGPLRQYFRTIETGEPTILDDYSYGHEILGEERRYDIRAAKCGDGIALTWRDVTDRHKSAQELAASEARYRLLAENASDVVWQVAPDGTLAWTSPSITKLLGWEPEDIIGLPAMGLVDPADRPQALHDRERVLNGERYQGEVRVLTKDGSSRWSSLTIHPVPTADGMTRIVAIRDVQPEHETRANLEFVLEHDQLTGLATRKRVTHRLDEILSTCEAPDRVGVLYIGLDALAEINDALGHAAGDLALATAATRLSTLAGSDLVGRGAGDELIAVVPGLRTGADAAEVAESVRLAIREPMMLDGHAITMTASIGIAVGSSGEAAEELLRDASLGMRTVKNTGRDQYGFVDPSMAVEAENRLAQGGLVREGIASGAFRPWLQPIVDFATMQPVGFEALARWIRPDGTGEPEDFIPVAVHAGLIADLDVAMLEPTIALLASTSPPVFIGLNVTGQTLSRVDYAALVRASLERHAVEPHRLHLEITETILLGLSDTVVSQMRELADLGCRWYVDDFGTGYSSISHLRDLPVHGLKLDKSFTNGVGDGDETSRQLAMAITGMANGLGLDTVAEGVETEAQAAFLRTLGWHHGQGWLFGPAQPPQ